jgi:NAD(P)-dependent dehydrogenase (short-subunit alcohol dehydrogenase family)
MRNICLRFILSFSFIIFSLSPFSTPSRAADYKKESEINISLSLPHGVYIIENEGSVTTLQTQQYKLEHDCQPSQTSSAKKKNEDVVSVSWTQKKNEQGEDEQPSPLKLTDDAVTAGSTKNIDTRLAGKNAFITGITSGIGLDLTKLCLAAGINVIGVGRKEEELSKLKEINEKERQRDPTVGFLHTITADLSDLVQILTIGTHVKEILGEDEKLNFDVFNAAVITPVGFEAVFNNPPIMLYQTLMTDLVAPIMLTNILSSYYAKHARLLYVSSIAGDRPGGGTLLYSVSKAGIDQFVRGLRKDRGLRKEKPLPEDSHLIDPWGKLDLVPVSVDPGNTRTQIHTRDLQEADDVAMPRKDFFKSMDRKLLPADVPATYLFWLLTKAIVEQYLKNEKHRIYDLDQQKLWWTGEPLIDPYPSNTTITSPTIPTLNLPANTSHHSGLSPMSISPSSGGLPPPLFIGITEGEKDKNVHKLDG